MAWYPLAIQTTFPGIGGYRSGPYKIIHHTTEGSSAAGAIATYKTTGSYPHFTVDEDVVYQHVDTETAVTALAHPAGTPETNRSHAIQIELVGFAGRAKSPTSLATLAALCRWLEQQHGIPAEWPSGFPRPAVNGRDPGGHNRDVGNWTTRGGHYGHSQVPHNSHWDPAYTAEEVAIVMGQADEGAAAVAAALSEGEPAALPAMAEFSGPSTEAAPATTGYVRALVAVATAEYAAYHGTIETDEPLRSRIDAYCRAIGIAPPGDVTAFPWSATFISWCIKTAGASRSEFAFSASHAVFVKAAIANADARRGVFRARPIDEYAPRIGDLIHRNRSRGTVTYAEARDRSDYPSHSAIVVEIGEDRIGRYATTIGGNESDSIRRTRVALRADGTVAQTEANPYICVVQDLKVDAEAEPQALVAEAADVGDTRRLEMAQIIVNYEARRDSRGRLEVYHLPPDDGGGRYEVAGINERFNKALCDELVALVESGRQAEAERRAVAFIAQNTDVAAGWTSNAAIEFYLRDCVFNRGTRGAAWILQKAVGVATDQSVGPETRAAVTRAEADPRRLLADLRAAREAYERRRRDETSRFWRGLVNRWNKALDDARRFLTDGGGGTALSADLVAPGTEPAFEPPPQAGRMEAVAEAMALAADAGAAAMPAPAVVIGRSDVGDELVAMHRELEAKIFARSPAAAFALGAATEPPEPHWVIVGVGIGSAHRDFESVGAAGPGAPVLNVYVTEPMGMDAAKAVLVDHLGMRSLISDSQPVNVIKSGPIEAHVHTHPARPSPCGISVGHFNVTAGTQGALVRGRSGARQNRLFMLSNNHVLANRNDCRAGDAILQPGPDDLKPDPANQVAVLERWVPLDYSANGDNYVDCAVAWCWPDRVRKDFIYRNGADWAYFTVGSQPVAPREDLIVGKSGRTTQLTSGRIIDVNASIQVKYGGGRVANFRDQISIKGNDGKAFSQPGDSGSLIWTWDQGRSPVGLLFAGGTELTFANKISHVLDALDIALFA